MPISGAIRSISLSLLCGVFFAAESIVPTCPAVDGHEPLVKSREGQNQAIEEGVNIIVDADSYPRDPANLTEGPTLYQHSDGSLDIRFALDRFDDVLVAVYDADGQLLRRLGCGVLGSRAPVPFEPDSLVQRITWDGLDAQGKPVPAGSSVRVSVGLQARFDRFIAHDPGQMVGYVNALSVDGQGRVYVGQHTGLRYDPQILRYDRDGNYLDLVYPSDPAQLAATGRQLQDVYEPVERFDDRVIPLKTGVWRYWMQRWEDFMRLPFAIGPDDKAYFVVGTPSQLEKTYFEADWDSRIFRVDDLDHFWFQPWDGPTHYAPVFFYRWDAAFCFGPDGDIYVACKSYAGGHGDYRLDDYGALGTVRRIDPQTGRNREPFRYRGEQALDTPSAYLGTPKTVVDRKVLNSLHARLDPSGWQPERLPEDRIDSFCDIEDLCVASDGRILVVDGHPRRIKCYDADGRWLGGIDEVIMAGTARRFCDIAAISWAGDRCYLLTSFLDDPDQSMHLLALDVDRTSAEPIWSVALDPLARFIAVDQAVEHPLVWVGNGNGLASISRITDLGERAGTVRHIGGMMDPVLVDPRAFTVDDDKNVYVHDHARGQLVRCRADG